MCRPAPAAARAFAGAAILVHTGLIVAAMFAAFGMLPGSASVSLLNFLKWYLVFFAVALTVGALGRAATPPDERRASCQNDLEFPRAKLILRWVWRGLAIALLAGGHYGLAGMAAFLVCLGTAKRVEDRRILGGIEAVNPVSRAIHRVVFGLCGLAAPVTGPVRRLLTRKVGEVPLFIYPLLIVVLPLVLVLGTAYIALGIPFHLYRFLGRRTNKARRERGLVKAAHAEGKLAWFAYAEPHQREHFLGAGGVLHEVAGRVIVRDWRCDLRARAHSVNDATGEDLDGALLARLNLTSMRDDLPVLVLLEADGRITAVFRLNRAYRERLRDGGDLLAKLEEGMRLHIRRAALPA